MIPDVSLFLCYKNLFQLLRQSTITAYSDLTDLVYNFLQLFHLFQLPQHCIVFHQLGSFFPTHDGIGLWINSPMPPF